MGERSLGCEIAADPFEGNARARVFGCERRGALEMIQKKALALLPEGADRRACQQRLAEFEAALESPQD